MKTQFPQAILAHWTYEIETIDISRVILHGEHSNLRTTGFWTHSGQTVEYVCSCSTEWRPDRSRVLTIQYQKDENPHLAKHRGLLWGTSKITLLPYQPAGVVQWKGKGDSEWFDCEWTTPEAHLIGERRRSSRTVATREQVKLREDLVRYDRECVVSGEKNQDVLDVAHIVSVEDGGRDVASNAVLLRADIHRLFDKGYFGIDLSGKIVLKKKMSSEYRRLLLGAKSLPSDATNRVRLALRQRVKFALSE
ncbi:MAG: HNH endonuclease [Rubrivivax sp.]|nr:HNH endonuclease [Rubrivivax sp.]